MALKLNAPALLKQQAFVNGLWVDATDRETFSVTNPATGTPVAKVALCGSLETEQAILAAQLALLSWRALSAEQRCDYLYRFYQLVVQHQSDLAQILTAEQGKPIAEAKAEILYGASYLRWFAEEAKRIYGDTIAAPSANKRIFCLKQPVGVVACITPWNFPHAMLARKIAPALAAGCTAVCKPANETPLSALALAELSLRAGIPAGVLNIVCGKTLEIGEALTSSSVVRKLTFTGSTAVGKQLVAACAVTMKRTSMELGGNAPFMVFEDADIDAAAAAAIAGKFRNAGQTCICINRILVHESVAERFTVKLTQLLRGLRLGNGADKGVHMGPLIHAEAASKVKSIVQDAIDLGATALQPVSETAHSCAPTAPFVVPTILTKVKKGMRAFDEEIFGPVAPIVCFKTEKEAIELANDTPFGLAAYFYTKDNARIWRVSEALDYGMVGVNDVAISNAMAPFGGVKESGHGREGSKYGLDDYLEIKYLSMGGIACAPSI